MKGIYDLIKAKDKKPLRFPMVNQKWLFILRRPFSTQIKLVNPPSPKIFLDILLRGL